MRDGGWVIGLLWGDFLPPLKNRLNLSCWPFAPHSEFYSDDFREYYLMRANIRGTKQPWGPAECLPSSLIAAANATIRCRRPTTFF